MFGKKKIRMAINGFGRIGRPSLKIALEKGIEVVAINDLTDIETGAHLLKYDSSYGVYAKKVSVDKENSELIIDGKKIKYFSEMNPKNLPWKDLGVDVVLECTGVFLTKEAVQSHIDSGAKKVLMSAPPKDDTPVYLLGVNEMEYQDEAIISNGSCTTNCLAPMIKVLDELCKIEKGFMTTTHSYTNDQRILDLPHKDLRRARAAAINIIPTSTGAAKTVGKVIKHLSGKIDGIALRVPTPVVSITDFVCTVKNPKSAEEIKEAFQTAAKNKLKGILDATDEKLVSMDFKMNPHSSIVDLGLTMAQDNMVKIVSWYDNEWGYSNRLVEMAQYITK
ncbi:MAG: NAD-dependent glyceraldehyde-3-phosphate dehydrogenase [Candidatus Moranbacteria bacterium GW2011_GWE2_35_2-]|nr:MAG: NAD-dependent glyceraldehyde-3-phosphate dehydrogenase [Candidatus Moranbacteria bacterium GW2011_GWE2_35_2-]KKQ04203.1 MAG: NAD-dependent glyceraldehyde-3-phosphate dehydrogenase [Candidatus Moranbacteria bacterium GW2011_GWF1_36_4]KKQ22766.1 MAG: NAD-dependent glyceraldehyde-3-phosphate dehydrogenase [Candidatus Moranbacteria bacterium GW2011_GWF2_37_11]KKQ28920.1 MAG: NAD-dependent glyceraldehyde-3-phosphate dehydrogenase [Candidatus Moranbacteria bacterium GW2011_GWD1_37_17]KKQ31003